MAGTVEDGLAELLGAVARGDRAAFAELYRTSGPTLFAVCVRLMRRRELAQEVLQEAFIRIWQKASLFDPKRGAAIAWLIALTRRCAIDRLRRYQVDEHATPLDEVAFDLVLPETAGAVGHDVKRCMSRLKDNERRAIALAFVYGLSHGELAVRMAAPLGTVKSWIRRGLGDLKACLER